MNVEIEMYIDEDDETLVMQKVSSLTKQAKDAGFKIGEIEFKRSRHKENEDKHKNKHHNENSSNSTKKEE
ncbi:MAG: hypothetical protein ACJ71M_04775 [Nitrososphaeraceae archaeon]